MDVVYYNEKLKDYQDCMPIFSIVSDKIGLPMISELAKH